MSNAYSETVTSLPIGLNADAISAAVKSMVAPNPPRPITTADIPRLEQERDSLAFRASESERVEGNYFERVTELEAAIKVKTEALPILEGDSNGSVRRQGAALRITIAELQGDLADVKKLHERWIKGTGSHKARLQEWNDANGETLKTLKEQERVLDAAFKKAGR